MADRCRFESRLCPLVVGGLLPAPACKMGSLRTDFSWRRRSGNVSFLPASALISHFPLLCSPSAFFPPFGLVLNPSLLRPFSSRLRNLSQTAAFSNPAPTRRPGSLAAAATRPRPGSRGGATARRDVPRQGSHAATSPAHLGVAPRLALGPAPAHPRSAGSLLWRQRCSPPAAGAAGTGRSWTHRPGPCPGGRGHRAGRRARPPGLPAPA